MLHGVGLVIAALGTGTDFACSILNYLIFHDACSSLIHKFLRSLLQLFIHFCIATIILAAYL